MGYTLRVDGFRFTEWYHWAVDGAAPDRPGPPAKRVDAGRPPVATELYALDDDALGDFDALEVANVASRPSARCVVDALRAALALFLAECQRGGAPHDPACDARVDAAAAAARCVSPAVFASFRARASEAGPAAPPGGRP